MAVFAHYRQCNFCTHLVFKQLVNQTAGTFFLFFIHRKLYLY